MSNKIKNTPAIKLVLFHVLAWVIFIGLMFFTVQVRNPAYKFSLPLTLLTYIPAAYIFYGSNYLLFKYLPFKRYKQLVISTTLFFITVCLVLFVAGYVMEPLIYGKVVSWAVANRLWGFFISTIFWLYLLLSGLSLGYYFARRTIIHQTELRIAEKSQLAAEQGKLEAEHAFLRAQINPHFLYNTLNFFYSKSLGGPPELSEGILVLNDIMRYSLESGDDTNGLVLLRNEIEHVRNVIRINQLRFSNRLKINFTINGEINALRIVPLVLITLVENAFKHGDLTSEDHPVCFDLRIDQVPQHRLTFASFNKKRHGSVEAYSGIGLANIRKRLFNAYGDDFALVINDEADCYKAVLILNL